MIRKSIIFILLLSLSTLSAYSNTTTDNYRKLLNKSKIVAANHESALNQAYVQKADSLLQLNPSKQNLIAAEQVVFDICFSLDQQDNHHDVISYISYCQPILKEIIPDEKEAYSIYINILDQYGVAYQNIGLASQGMNIFFKALALAEYKNLKSETTVLYNNIAATYAEQHQYAKADSIYTKAIRINEELKDKEKLFVNYNNLSVLASKQNDHNKALEYAFLAIHQLKARKDSSMIMLMLRNISGIYLHKGERKLALQYLQEVKSYQEKHNEHRYLMNTYNMMAEIYIQQEDSFLYYLKKTLKVAHQNNSITDNTGILFRLSSFYEKKKDYAQANFYLKQYANIRDSILASDKQTQVDNLLNMYLEEQQQHTKIEQIQQEQTKTIRLMRIISVISVMIILFGFIYGILKLRKERKNYFNKVRRHLRKRQDMLSGQRDRIMSLIDEIEKKNELLNLNEKKRTVLSLQAIRSQEFIMVLIEELKQLLLELNPRDNNTKKHIRDIISRLNQMSNDSTQKEFIDSFENIYQKFYDTLSAKYPNLTIRELRLCALIHIGLSNKEIADITFREIRSVEAARNRLRKKLALSQYEDLSKFLMQF